MKNVKWNIQIILAGLFFFNSIAFPQSTQNATKGSYSIPLQDENGNTAARMERPLNFNRNQSGNYQEYSYAILDGETNKEIGRMSAPFTIEKSSPSELRNAFNNFSKAFKSLRTETKTTIKEISPWAAMGQTMRQFPLEFIGFQAGIGFLALSEMAIRYHANPMGFQQAWETLTLDNSIGGFSFFSFMYASRLSAPIWQRLITSPHVRAYFPMFIGMIASNFSHLYLEPLAPCAKDIVKNMELKKRMDVQGIPESCTKAYDDLVLKQSFIDMAPGIISGLLSFPVSGALTSAIHKLKGSKNILEQAIDRAGKPTKALNPLAQEEFVKAFSRSWKMLLNFVPGVGKIKLAGTLLSHTAKNAVMFLGVDQFIVHPLVMKGQLAFFSGPSIKEKAENMSQELLAVKESGWSKQAILKNLGEDYFCSGTGTQDCTEGFPAKLQLFHEGMSKWRQENMSSAQMAHAGWNSKFSKVTAMYEGSYSTYQRLITDIVTSLNQEEASQIDQADRFHGIKPLVKNDKKVNMLSYGSFMNDTLVGPTQSDLHSDPNSSHKGEEARKFHVKNWKKGSQKINEILAQYKNNKEMPFKQLSTLEHISKNWNPEIETKNVKLITQIRNGKADPNTIQNNLSEICSTQFKNDQSKIKRIATILPNERTSSEKALINDCYNYWSKKQTDKILEGARLFGQITDATQNNIKHLPNELKLVLQKVKEAVGEATLKLYEPEGVKFSADSFLDNTAQVNMLQQNRLSAASELMKSEMSKLKANKTKMGTSFAQLEELTKLWDITEETKAYFLIQDLAKSNPIDSKDIPLLRKALADLSNDDFKKLMSSSDPQTSLEKNAAVLTQALMNQIKTINQKTDKGLSLYRKLTNSPQALSPAALEIFNKVRNFTGTSTPVKEAGRAHLSNFEIHSAYSQHYDLIEYDKNPGLYTLNTPAEFFVYQMICGKDPEVGDSLVTKKWLTNDTFEAPRIRSTNHSMKLFCDPAIDQKAKHTWELGKYKYADSDAGNKKMYTDDIVVNTINGEQKTYKGILDYLKNNIRSSIIEKKLVPNESASSKQALTLTNPSQNSIVDESLKKAMTPTHSVVYTSRFAAWWEENVTSQLNKLFNSYAQEYSKVIGLLQSSFASNGRDYYNTLSSSPMYSIQQEARFYLTIINELYKDLGAPPQQVMENSEAQKNNTNHNSLLTKNNAIKRNNINILKALKTYPLIDLYLPSQTNSKSTSYTLSPVGESLLKYDASLKKILTLFNRNHTSIQVKDLSKTYDSSLEEMEKSLESLKIASEEQLNNITVEQREVLEQCFSILAKINLEIKSYQLFVTLLNYGNKKENAGSSLDDFTLPE